MFAKTTKTTKTRADGKTFASIGVEITPIQSLRSARLKRERASEGNSLQSIDTFVLVYADGTEQAVKLTDQVIALPEVAKRSTTLADAIAGAPKARETKRNKLTADLKLTIDNLLSMQGKGQAVELINQLLFPMLFGTCKGSYSEVVRDYLISRISRSVNYQVFRTLAKARSQSAEIRRAVNARESAEKKLARITTRQKDRQKVVGGLQGLTDAALVLANERLAKADLQAENKLAKSRTDTLRDVDTKDLCDDAVGHVLAKLALGNIKADRSLLSNAKRLTAGGVEFYLRRTRFDTSYEGWSDQLTESELDSTDLYTMPQEAYEASVRKVGIELEDILRELRRACKAHGTTAAQVNRLEGFVTLSYYGESERAYSADGAGRTAKSRDAAFLRALAEADQELRDVLTA